jgi:hypothetical protein
VGVVVGGVKFLMPRWAHLGRQAREAVSHHIPEQRRAPRALAVMPVLLYGRLGDEPFQEQAETIDVSAHGGLVPISAEVTCAQKLLLTNLQTNEEMACRVARLVRTQQGKTLAGLEFLQPAPCFWGESLPSGNGVTFTRRRS